MSAGRPWCSGRASKLSAGRPKSSQIGGRMGGDLVCRWNTTCGHSEAPQHVLATSLGHSITQGSLNICVAPADFMRQTSYILEPRQNLWMYVYLLERKFLQSVSRSKCSWILDVVQPHLWHVLRQADTKGNLGLLATFGYRGTDSTGVCSA